MAATAEGAHAQDRPDSPAPTQTSAWACDRVVHLRDGRTFVSDGRFLLDAALAKPAATPSKILGEATAKIVDGYLTAPLTDEFSVSQLATRDGNYVAPSGVLLNAAYIDYLRQNLPASRLRLRMKSGLEPVVILLDGKSVGLLMPMRR